MLCGPNRSGSATRSESHFLWVPFCSMPTNPRAEARRCLSVPLAFVLPQHTREQVEKKKFPCQKQTHRQDKLKPGEHPGARAGLVAAAPTLSSLPPQCPSVHPPSRRAEAFPAVFFCGNGKRVGGGRGVLFCFSCRAMSCHFVSCYVLGMVGCCVSSRRHSFGLKLLFFLEYISGYIEILSAILL